MTGVLLPLFPLGTVLVPGLVLPLQLFEPRYLQLMADLLELPEDERRFGVVTIKDGHEVGEEGVRALHAVGTTAELVSHTERPDGMIEIVTTGGRRFALGVLDHGLPYLRGEVELLAEDDGDPDEAALLARGVAGRFADYLAALASVQGATVTAPDQLPDDPGVLSYLVTATVLVDHAVKQQLLATPATTDRLRAQLRLLRVESTLMRTLSSVPTPDFGRAEIHVN